MTVFLLIFLQIFDSNIPPRINGGPKLFLRTNFFLGDDFIRRFGDNRCITNIEFEANR